MYEVTQWGWRAGLTKAQIDLMLFDQPVVEYNTKRKREKKKKIDYSGKSVKAKAERALDALKEARAKGEDRLENLNINGKTIQL